MVDAVNNGGSGCWQFCFLGENKIKPRTYHLYFLGFLSDLFSLPLSLLLSSYKYKFITFRLITSGLCRVTVI